MNPVNWLTRGHTEYLVGAVIIPGLLVIPLSRVINRRLKVLTLAAMAIMVLHFSLMPFLSAALARSELISLKTSLDRDGVCLQGTGYTCGPAAAITGLKRLGLTGEESEIGLQAFTCNAVGTEPDVLAATLNRLYGADGLRCEYRRFKNMAELKEAGITIAIIKFDWTTDHYVTVLEVTENLVIAGDPLFGVRRYAHDDFSQIWRRVGVVMARGLH